MNKTMSVGAVACAIAMAVACGEDERLGPGTATGGAAGAGATGGAGGSGGSAGSGGASGAGAAAGSGGAAGADAATGGSGGDAGLPPGRLLVAGTDFFSKTEVASIDLATQTVIGSVTLNDGDAVPAQSNGQGFVIERTNAKLHHLDATGQPDKSVDVGKTAVGVSGTGTTNPVGVIATGSGASGQALVFLQSVNRVAVVDLSAGQVTKTIDLGAYQDSADADGSVDVTSPVHVTASGRAYFLLGRIDRTTVAAPSYQLACPTVKALLLAIDVAQGTLVDLNGSATGEGIELSLSNPVDAALDSAQNRLLVLSAGCYVTADGGSVRVKHGIEAVDLASGAVTAAYSAANQDFLSRLVLRSATQALVNTFDASFGEHWWEWTPSQSSFGSELSGVPAAPSLEDAGHLLGVDITTGDASSSVQVVRYDLGTKQKTLVVASPWTGTFSSAAGTALVR